MAKKILVVYYSWGDNTKAVGGYIAQKLGVDRLELKTKVSYPSDYNGCVNRVGRDGKTYEPELAVAIPDLSEYDTVFAGAPCWWGTIANPLRTFLYQNDLSGKTVIPFMTHGTSGLQVQDMKKLYPDSRMLPGLSIYNCYQVTTRTNTVANMGNYKEQVDRWLDNLLL